MITLSKEQREVLDTESPPIALDPVTNEKYVLIRSAAYERIRQLVDDDMLLSKRELAILVERAMQDYDAGDPTLHLYQTD